MPPQADKPLELLTPVQYLKGCGASRAELLNRLGIRTVRDLLFYFPRDYQDLSELQAIADLEEGKAASVLATVAEIDSSRTSSGGSIVGVLLRQGNHYLRAVWFNQPFLQRKFAAGQTVVVSGKPTLRGMRWEMTHPIVKHIETEDDEPRGELLPIYPLTEGLNQHRLRILIRAALEAGLDQLDEVFPEAYLQQHQLLPLREALPRIHFPASSEDLERARRRLIYQELFILQLALAIKRFHVRSGIAAYPLEVSAKIDSRIRRLLPFELTAGQNQAIHEITADMQQAVPMNRLLQGDVGSGKTIVAVYAMLVTVAQGAQVVLMAPTEVLARQHVATLERLLSGSHTRIGWLAGGQTAKERQAALAGIASGETQIIVGTQAVISSDIVFNKLALVIIDEQHKFGVRQRARLKYAGAQPHYLVMTATPIPRTVALTLFGDLDVTTLADRPPGRQPVHTYAPSLEQRSQWWEFFRKKLREGRQGYVIVPLVAERAADVESSAIIETESETPEGSDSDTLRTNTPPMSLEAAYEALANGELEAFRIGVVHGRMTSHDKQAALESFRRGDIQVLVATSVVEVGIDVPNATLMTIENAERFGLAQLHQLRGRVSRGSYPGYCALFAGSQSAEATTRLQALVDNGDGFKLAEIDFALRGPGDMLGTRQHGLPPLRIADLHRDLNIVEEARADALALMQQDPQLAQSELSQLRRMALVRYGETLELGDVG
jgi:ATP-dependent DNA helicase RecG